MRILYVCTANICRSALAEQMLLDSVAAVPELSHVEVLSAGTDAILGRPGCPMVTALAGNPREHLAQPLTADLVHWADLIMPASRDHRLAISELDLASRSRSSRSGRRAD